MTLIVGIDQRESPHEAERGRGEGEPAGKEGRVQAVQPIRSGHGRPRPIRHRTASAGTKFQITVF